MHASRRGLSGEHRLPAPRLRGLGSLPRPGNSVFSVMHVPKMLPAGLPATTPNAFGVLPRILLAYAGKYSSFFSSFDICLPRRSFGEGGCSAAYKPT